MKIKPEHYTHILESIRPLTHLLESHRIALIKEGKAKDIDKRLRWDAIYAARLTTFICDQIYPYANDEHIDTVLRQVIKEVQG